MKTKIIRRKNIIIVLNPWNSKCDEYLRNHMGF